ncbi:EamA family transporter [Saccharopolyspora indica]|uniref:EamA family transporter n=1 Tax=Saccharopolyspora indica TaxID=1229659 RepID=UPI0022EB04F1|nr:EamA family transporter [Saccharopolyspora indica]MDA3643107.1 EamA family transporter [Saccharopolyspora indica]
MIALGIALVAIAAVAHAGWNVCAKRLSDGGAPFVWLYKVVGSVVVLPVGIVTLVLTSGEVHFGYWLIAVSVGAVLQLSYYLLLQRGYATSDLSVIYPLSSGMAPLFAVVAAMILLGERPSPMGFLAVAVVIAGVVVISVHSSQGDSPRGTKLNGVLYGALIGAANALATVWDKQAVSGMALSPFLVYWGISMFEVLLLAPFVLPQRDRLSRLWRQHRREVLIVGVLAPTAYILVLFSMRLAPVSVIAPAKELSIVMALFGAWFFLKEREILRRFLGAMVVISGVLMLTFS